MNNIWQSLCLFRVDLFLRLWKTVTFQKPSAKSRKIGLKSHIIITVIIVITIIIYFSPVFFLLSLPSLASTAASNPIGFGRSNCIWGKRRGGRGAVTTKSGRMAPVKAGKAILACFGAGTGVLTEFGLPTHLRPNSDPSPTHLRPISDPSPTQLRPISDPSPTHLRPNFAQKTPFSCSDPTFEPNFAQKTVFFSPHPISGPTVRKKPFSSHPTSGNSMLPQNRLFFCPDTSLTNSDQTSEPNFAQNPFIVSPDHTRG